jgi:hypothetical protein
MKVHAYVFSWLGLLILSACSGSDGQSDNGSALSIEDLRGTIWMSSRCDLSYGLAHTLHSIEFLENREAITLRVFGYTDEDCVSLREEIIGAAYEVTMPVTFGDSVLTDEGVWATAIDVEKAVPTTSMTIDVPGLVYMSNDVLYLNIYETVQQEMDCPGPLTEIESRTVRGLLYCLIRPTSVDFDNPYHPL